MKPSPGPSQIIAAEFRHVSVLKHLSDPSRCVVRLEVGEGEVVNVAVHPFDLLGMSIYLHACARQLMSADEETPPAMERPN